MPYIFARSEALSERATRSLARGTDGGAGEAGLPLPLYFERGSGPNLWDLDGNHYLDFQLGEGALIFGHAAPGLTEALTEQARRGTALAAHSELEVEVAEKIQSMIPSAERIRFGHSAQEMMFAAFRVAQAQTGRRLILRFEGHVAHGIDAGNLDLVNHTGVGVESMQPSLGVEAKVAGLDSFIVARWNDSDALRRSVEAFRGRIAAIVFEPALRSACCIEPVPGWMSTIRELCDRDGMLMISDETFTGFRFGAAGAQGYYGYRPDLTVLSQTLGETAALAALAGTQSAMAKLRSDEIRFAGLPVGHPLGLAGSRWCLAQIAGLGATHPGRINRLGTRLMAGLSALGREHDVPLRPQGPGLVFHTVLLKAGQEEGLVRDARDYARRHDARRWAQLRRCLVEEGVCAMERGLWTVSLAHEDADIDEALARAARAFRRHASTWMPLAGP